MRYVYSIAIRLAFVPVEGSPSDEPLLDFHYQKNEGRKRKTCRKVGQWEGLSVKYRIQRGKIDHTELERYGEDYCAQHEWIAQNAERGQ